MNERNGAIIGYYIRYGLLGSETLSKKTIRDTENLQVGTISLNISLDISLDIFPDIFHTISLKILTSFSTFASQSVSDDNIWPGPFLKILGHGVPVHIGWSRAHLQQECGGNFGRR